MVVTICNTLLFICLDCFLHDFLIIKLIYISYKLISHTTVPFASFDLLCNPGLKIAYKFTKARKHRTPLCLKENGWT